MNANQIISGLNSEFLSSENIESLVYLNEEVIGCSLPYSAYIKKEYGEIDGKKIVSAIENMKKNNSNNITPEELLIMLENDIDNEDINGWNGRLVEYEGCVVEAWDVQLEETIYKIKRRIKKVSRMASEREKQKLKAVSTFKNNINDIVSEDDDNPRLTYIADPFKDDYILTGGNSCYVGFLSWDGTRDIKKNDFYSIADIKVRDCIVADINNFIFLKAASRCNTYFAIDKSKINVLYRRDATNYINISDDTKGYDDDFLEWYDDVYGDSLFASAEKLSEAYKEWKK